jgi:nicotinate-nucleotide pyrophosphorylase (carboxylating)
VRRRSRLHSEARPETPPGEAGPIRATTSSGPVGSPGRRRARRLTTDTLVPAAARARGPSRARPGVLAGGELFARVRAAGSGRVRRTFADGALARGDSLLELEGRARALLTGERTALNLVQRLSGIATLTARFVAAARPVRVLDTRKTTPGLRALEKYAVLCGGGENHRFGLYDQAMVKNNHIDLARADLGALLAALRARHGPELVVTAEARDEREALAVVAGDADVVLLDNFAPAALAALCPKLRAAARGRARPLELEASGGITLENAAEFARAGVDRMSVGALTHSAPAPDLALHPSPGDGPAHEDRHPPMTRGWWYAALTPRAHCSTRVAPRRAPPAPA